jgi:hypothetical protein
MRRGYGGGFRDELVTQSLTTGTIVAASAFDEVTEFISSIVGLAPSDEKQTSRCYVLGYGDWPAALYATEDDFHLLITSGNGARAMGSTSM